LLFQHDLIDQRGELLREKREQADGCVVFVGRDEDSSQESRILFVKRTPCLTRFVPLAVFDFSGACRKTGRYANHNLIPSFTGTAVSVNPNGHVTVVSHASMLNHLLMCFQANAQRSGMFREQSTKRVFVFLPVMSQLPIL
jgi:hypothetical protein